MREWFSTGVSLLVLASTLGLAAPSPARADDLVQYEVTNVSDNWMVTATELGSGNVVKFKVRAATFKGQTFEADIDEASAGRSFSAKGPRNATIEASSLESGRPGKKGKAASAGSKGADKDWEIVSVDTNKWIVTARKGKGGPLVHFEVQPSAFVGYRFYADLKGVGQGQGFKIVAPNDSSVRNCCRIVD
ncbi:MAG: hypothetical protein JXB39_15470 [Deltaproteobacteria bacterium]|nr:hypothetical protein [Deltaproteobacteria bacterium]